MPRLDTQEVLREVRLVVGDVLSHLPGIASVPDEDELRDHGVVSMDLVNVVLSIERALRIRIPDHCVTPENFRTFDSIARMIVNTPDA